LELDLYRNLALPIIIQQEIFTDKVSGVINHPLICMP
jgi:hypothetical protein